jgi:DNA-binding beta-propeller fold protein YncE
MVRSMSVTLGRGKFKYEALEQWGKLPEGWSLVETPGVAVDSKDRVFALTRGEHPVIVFDREGNFLRSFGEGLFSKRTHGMFIGPDDSVYCVDDGHHTITKFSPEGKVLMTIGAPGKPAHQWSGEPFNRPTHVAVSPKTGNLYVTDGYGNSRVHKFTPDGRHLLSWGEPGVDPGQFIRPHNVAVDADDYVYVADRENQRVQVFNADGRHVATWHDIHRPDGLTLAPDGNIYIGELNGLDDAPGLGHRVSILSRKGELLARLGHPELGDEPGRFIAPHGIAVDSRGDVYVGEVSFTIHGRHLNPPREFQSLRKLRKLA